MRGKLAVGALAAAGIIIAMGAPAAHASVASVEYRPAAAGAWQPVKGDPSMVPGCDAVTVVTPKGADPAMAMPFAQFLASKTGSVVTVADAADWRGLPRVVVSGC